MPGWPNWQTPRKRRIESSDPLLRACATEVMDADSDGGIISLNNCAPVEHYRDGINRAVTLTSNRGGRSRTPAPGAGRKSSTISERNIASATDFECFTIFCFASLISAYLPSI